MKKISQLTLLLILLISSASCSETKEAALYTSSITLPAEQHELHHLLLREYRKKIPKTEKTNYPSIYEKNKDGVTNPYVEFIFGDDVKGGELKKNLKEYLTTNPDQAGDYYSLWTIFYLEQIGIKISDLEGGRVEASSSELKITARQEEVEYLEELLNQTNE
ncbi:hypothetical protein DDZ13_14985 [Coraliomargarita sinensis]|uniref:Lipoprotein n=1 Tax=Coraliomargarita sinensis TaxID=2174842 RepID=A0A317ZEU2_9BACT|nr:hypothetical protein [Coraliomargarita sinensis]PXA02857.1 hypothetical protein DDZ13_14985 [Coraliomargarita sinensis]